jgi:MFS family permease
MLVTIWELGEAIGPLFIAPLSEIFGRYRLYLTMNTMFIMAIVFAALSPTAELLIVSRALMGISAASNVLNPAIVGDMFVPEQRGTAMSLIMFVPLMGGTVGPVLSGAIVQSLGWRAIIWVSVALACICQVLLFVFFRETYKVQILKQKEARLQMNNESSMSSSEKDGPTNVDLTGLRDSIIRPVIVLFNSSVLATLVLFGSFMFAHFYIVSTTLPDILEGIYGLSPTATGLAFIANGESVAGRISISASSLANEIFTGLGTVISFVISKVFLDKIYIKLRVFNNGIGLPEYRLPLSIIGALSLPPAVILYGWCAEYKLPLPILLLSMIWLRISMMLGSSPLTAYIVDACGLYSASAMAGLISIRCLAGAFLPLTIARLTGKFGYGGGFSVLGAFGTIFALIPVLVLRYGPKWRERSRYTTDTLK